MTRPSELQACPGAGGEACRGRIESAVVLASLVLALAGCGKTVVELEPSGSVGGSYFHDLRGVPYAETFVRDYRYAESRVQVVYARRSSRGFEAEIRASGLKPDFCYQLKLEGKPTKLWSEGGDDAGNLALGSAGRWWRIEPQAGLALEDEIKARRDDPLYVYAGYLLFDFLVTDSHGNANAEASSERAYDRIHRRSDREPAARDGPLRLFVIDGTTVELYGEAVPERGKFGAVSLRAGRYDVQLSLTEETFGEAPRARVLAAADIEFTVTRW